VGTAYLRQKISALSGGKGHRKGRRGRKLRREKHSLRAQKTNPRRKETLNARNPGEGQGREEREDATVNKAHAERGVELCLQTHQKNPSGGGGVLGPAGSFDGTEVRGEKLRVGPNRAKDLSATQKVWDMSDRLKKKSARNGVPEKNEGGAVDGVSVVKVPKTSGPKKPGKDRQKLRGRRTQHWASKKKKANQSRRPGRGGQLLKAAGRGQGFV